DAVVAMGAPVGREVAVARAATGTRAGALQALSESSASAPRRTASRKMRRSVMYIVVLLCRGSAVGKKVGAVESSAAPIRTTFAVITIRCRFGYGGLDRLLRGKIVEALHNAGPRGRMRLK